MHGAGTTRDQTLWRSYQLHPSSSYGNRILEGRRLADGTPAGSNTRRPREQQPTCQAVMYKVNQPYHFTGIHPATMARVTFKINEVVFGIEVKEPRLCRAWDTDAIELQSHSPCLMADAQQIIEQPGSICSHKIWFLFFAISWDFAIIWDY